MTAASSKTAPRFVDHAVLIVLSRLLVGGYMVYSSLHKIDDPVSFLKLINQYDLVPSNLFVLLNLTSVVLPWLELIGGLALVLGILRQGAGVIMLAMLSAFTAAIAFRTWQIMHSTGTPFMDIKFSCGCAGSEEQIIWIKLLSNALLIILSLIAVISRSQAWSLTSLWPATNDAKQPDSKSE